MGCSDAYHVATPTVLRTSAKCRLKKTCYSGLILRLRDDLRVGVSGAWYQPKLFWLSRRGKIPQAIARQYHGISLVMNDQQWPGTDFGDHVHRPDASNINSRSPVGDGDRYGGKWEGGKMNEMFEGGSDHAWTITEGGIIYDCADALVFAAARIAEAPPIDIPRMPIRFASTSLRPAA